MRSAESFIAFVMLGVGMFLGSIASGWVVDRYPPAILVTAQVESKADGKTHTERLPLPEWDAACNDQFPKKMDLKPGSLVRPDNLPADYFESDPLLGTVTHYDHASFVEAVSART